MNHNIITTSNKVNFKDKFKQFSLKLYDKCLNHTYSEFEENLRRNSINSNQTTNTTTTTYTSRSSSSTNLSLKLSKTLSLPNIFKIESKKKTIPNDTSNELLKFDMTYSRDNLLQFLRDENNGLTGDDTINFNDEIISFIEDEDEKNNEFTERKEVYIPPLPSDSYENLNKSKIACLNYLNQFNKFSN
ncbi:unnamed protein product [Candida verbasci]|uniref:Uncharacterized protein n=1 Tax=Candida verbasci TaxID=1227364 RepID=A0A9W4TYB4_9ASCO|nr:unnamed protein product [Candida verbasci]